MEEQRLQSLPEVIDGEMIEEIEMSTKDAEVNKEDVTKEEDDEEFYERIEAPKFVDFTKPYTFRTDDRYWFCSRVGCDQKHDEELNPEEIYKKFVLRVLAARSPNIKLRKALKCEHSSTKCPLSAPAKPSKPRIPRLAIVSSSISHKIGDPQINIKPRLKVGSTPVVKTRQVAAKYMTTPRNKQCPLNSNSFRSVQNTKTATVDEPKNRTVAKALVFHYPKKAISLKKSVELHTPLRKICEGIKRLEIASQKETSKCIKSTPKKPETEDSSRRQLRICKGDKKSKELVPSKTTKTPNKKIPTSKGHILHKQVIGTESGDLDLDVKLRDGSTADFTKKKKDSQPQETLDVDVKLSDGSTSDFTKKKEDLQTQEDSNVDVKLSDGSTSDFTKIEYELHPQETSDTSTSHSSVAKVNSLSMLEDKENMGIVEDHSIEMVTGYGRELMNDDGKENNLNPEDNNRFNIQPMGYKILGKETHKTKKIVQTLDKNGGPAVVKYKKPKPTCVKPFRLRTDERGILKEATLERKLHFSSTEKDDVKDTSVIKRKYQIQKNKKFAIEESKDNDSVTGNCGKESGGVGSKIAPMAARKLPESTQLRTRSPYLQQQPQGGLASSPRKPWRPGPQLSVINEKSTKLTSDIMVAENNTRAIKVSIWLASSPRKPWRPGPQLSVINEKSTKLTSDIMVAENNTRATSAARSTSRGKRSVTIAKEPNFHSSHLPRTCSKKIA